MPANMASPSSQGRRRTPVKTSTEDQALNVIASESMLSILIKTVLDAKTAEQYIYISKQHHQAEARLAAKRAARAEARIIRMKELEKAQQEADEKMDREYQRSLITDEPLKPRASRVSEKIIQTRVTPTIENEMNGPVSQETQIRTLQDTIRDVNEKYKKAMVSNAQLDNEKQALAYQVDCLKDRLEEAEEEVENLKQEIIDKTRELNRVKYENKTHMEELEKAREQLILRDKLLEEHGIPTDGSEQPDISQVEISSRINDSVNLDAGDYDISATYDSSRKSSAPDDRDSLLEQIKVLKDQVSDLRRNPDFEDERLRDIESLQNSDDRNYLSSTNTGQDFEKSETFEDVTDEAIEIHDRLRGGLVVNNNERNEEFDVIDQNLRQGQLSNFEDKSFECSTGLSLSVNESIADSYVDSFRSNVINDSLDSEKPLEISITADSDNEASPTDNKRQEELVDYDIVETSTASAKPYDQSKNFELPIENGAEVGPEKQDERNIGEVAGIDVEMYEKQVYLDMIDVTAESQALLAGGVIDNIVSANEGTGSDIVDIELLSVSPGEDNDSSRMLILNLDGKENVSETAEMSEDIDKCLVDNEGQVFAEEGQGVKDVSTNETDVVNSQSETGHASETSKNSKDDDDDGFDNIESDEIFVDARSELSEDDDHSSFEKEENFEEASEADAEHFEEVHLPAELIDAPLVGQQIHITDTVIVPGIDDGKLDSRGGTMLVPESDNGEKRIDDNDEKTFSETSQVCITDECKDVQDEVNHESVSVSKEVPDGDEDNSGEIENDLVTLKERSPADSTCVNEEVVAFDEREEGNTRGVEMCDEVSDSVKDIDVSNFCPENDGKIVSVEEGDCSVIKDNDNSLPTSELIENSGEEMTGDMELVLATNKVQVSEKEGEHDMEGQVNAGGDKYEIALHQEVAIATPDDEKDTNDTVDDSNDFEICEENVPSCIVESDAEVQNEIPPDKESMLQNLVGAESCEDGASDDEKVGGKDEKPCEVDVNAYVQIEEVPINTSDKEGDHSSKVDHDVHITDNGSLNRAEYDVSEKERENGKIGTDTLTGVADSSDFYDKQMEAVDIPVVDYPMNEDQTDESSSNVEEEKHSTSEVATDISHTHAGGGEDQLITAFETRKRLGSFSPGSQRKEPLSLPGNQQKEPSSPPGNQQKEPSSQPVPKERKKKKKKNKKGTVKMLVRDLIQMASDSDGSGVEATAETSCMAGKPDDINVDEGQQFVEGKDTDHVHGDASEGGEKQGLDGTGNKVSELKGLEDKSETEGKLSKDPSFDSQDELMSVKEPVVLEDAKCGGTSETSDAETAEAVTKGKGKDKSKSRKESKKDGCKSQ